MAQEASWTHLNPPSSSSSSSSSPSAPKAGTGDKLVALKLQIRRAGIPTSRGHSRIRKKQGSNDDPCSLSPPKSLGSKVPKCEG